MAPCELVSPETCQSSLVEPKSSAAERASGKCLGAERQTRTDRQRLLGSCLRQGRCHRRHTDDTARVLDGKNNLYLYFIITNAFCKSGLIGLSSFRRASFWRRFCDVPNRSSATARRDEIRQMRNQRESDTCHGALNPRPGSG